METKIPDNLYLSNQIVHDPEKLVGRGDLLRRIYAVIEVKGSIALVGPPNIGKSSVLSCLRCKELQQRYGGAYAEKLPRYIFVYVDMRVEARRSWEGFFNRLNKAIVNQSQNSVNLEGISNEGSEGFTLLVDEITDQGYRLVLLLASFEKLRENGRLSGQLPTFLRAEARRVSYVVASTLPLSEIFPKEPLSSPFYNIFNGYEKVGGLAPADARTLIVRPAKNAKTPFSEEEIDWILKQAGTHPFFLWRVCQVLFDMKARVSMSLVDLDVAGEAAYQMLYTHFSSLWDTMSERQQEELSHELRKQEAQMFYGSALFRRFVEVQFAKETVIQLEEIKDALKKLSDLSLLGKSRLRHLKIVTKQFDGNARPSHSELGLTLRTVLTEAWNCLKGQGQRSDLAPDWEAYNILYYSCFKHHMKNNVICARLAMSPRTYYRSKNEALKKLLQALQELEDNCPVTY